MQPARDWLLPSGVLVTSPTCTGGTLLVPVLHSVWAPGEFGHHHLALPSPGDAAAGSTTQPALGWGQLQLCPQGEGLPCPAAPQHAALQPQIPSPIPPERGRALWSQDEGTGGDSLPRALPALPVEPGEPWELRAQPGLPQRPAEGRQRRSPGAGCAGPMGWEGGGCRTAPFPCGVCPAPAAAFALPVLGLPSATAALPDSLPPSHSASWLLSNSLCPSPIFLLDRRSRLMHLETLQPFLVAVD